MHPDDQPRQWHDKGAATTNITAYDEEVAQRRLTLNELDKQTVTLRSHNIRGIRGVLHSEGDGYFIVLIMEHSGRDSSGRANHWADIGFWIRDVKEIKKVNPTVTEVWI